MLVVNLRQVFQIIRNISLLINLSSSFNLTVHSVGVWLKRVWTECVIYDVFGGFVLELSWAAVIKFGAEKRGNSCLIYNSLSLIIPRTCQHFPVWIFQAGRWFSLRQITKQFSSEYLFACLKTPCIGFHIISFQTWWWGLEVLGYTMQSIFILCLNVTIYCEKWIFKLSGMLFNKSNDEDVN